MNREIQTTQSRNCMMFVIEAEVGRTESILAHSMTWYGSMTID